MKRKIVLEENKDGTFRYEYNTMLTEPYTRLSYEAIICYPRVRLEIAYNFKIPSEVAYIINEVLPEKDDKQTLYTISIPGKEGDLYV